MEDLPWELRDLGSCYYYTQRNAHDVFAWNKRKKASPAAAAAVEGPKPNSPHTHTHIIVYERKGICTFDILCTGARMCPAVQRH